MSEPETPPTRRDDVYAIFVAGFVKHEVQTLSWQKVMPSKEVAEAHGLIRWQSEYPNAKQLPVVHVLGPYTLWQ